jgi:hypothetical protein
MLLSDLPLSEIKVNERFDSSGKKKCIEKCAAGEQACQYHCGNTAASERLFA